MAKAIVNKKYNYVRIKAGKLTPLLKAAMLGMGFKESNYAGQGKKSKTTFYLHVSED